QPVLVLEPKRVHRLAGGRYRVRVDLERDDVAAVGLDQPADGLGPVALAHEGEEIAAVEIVAIEREAASIGVHFAQREKAPRGLRAHHALELALAETAVAAARIRLGVHRKPFGDPGGLERVRKEKREPPEDAPQRIGWPLGLVE